MQLSSVDAPFDDMQWMTMFVALFQNMEKIPHCAIPSVQVSKDSLSFATNFRFNTA